MHTRDELHGICAAMRALAISRGNHDAMAGFFLAGARPRTRTELLAAARLADEIFGDTNTLARFGRELPESDPRRARVNDICALTRDRAAMNG